MDYGRYKYERKKKQGKNKGHTASLKEVKLRPRTDQHDLDFKLKNARRFLLDGDKVKVTVMFRGREMVHREFGYRQLEQVTELLSDIANVENPPRMEGRFLSMILVPNREAIAEAARRAQARGHSAEAEMPLGGAEAGWTTDIEAKTKKIEARTPAAGDSGTVEAAEVEINS
jgi:translation initiation factor IF-3